jgi:hypothetical protein
LLSLPYFEIKIKAVYIILLNFFFLKTL